MSKNPATGGDTLRPHFWFHVFYYFYSYNFVLHNWNLLGRIYLLTKVIGILGVFLYIFFIVKWSKYIFLFTKKYREGIFSFFPLSYR